MISELIGLWVLFHNMRDTPLYRKLTPKTCFQLELERSRYHTEAVKEDLSLEDNIKKEESKSNPFREDLLLGKDMDIKSSKFPISGCIVRSTIYKHLMI